MKKSLIIMMTILLLSACSSGDSAKTDNLKQNNTIASPEEKINEITGSNLNDGNTIEPANSISADKIEIIKEYSKKPSKYSNYTYHFIVIKNNNQASVSVASNSKVYNTKDELIGAAKASITILGPGATTVLVESINDVSDASYFKTTFSVTEPLSSYQEINSFVSMELNATANKVIVSLDNVGNIPALFVKTYVLFLDSEGNCIDFDYGYMQGTDNEIKPGESITEQFETKEAYANAEVYFNGFGEK